MKNLYFFCFILFGSFASANTPASTPGEDCSKNFTSQIETALQRDVTVDQAIAALARAHAWLESHNLTSGYASFKTDQTKADDLGGFYGKLLTFEVAVDRIGISKKKGKLDPRSQLAAAQKSFLNSLESGQSPIGPTNLRIFPTAYQNARALK